MQKALKVCKKCGKPIYEETYFVNVHNEDGFCYHERCLKDSGFMETSIGYLKNNSRCYMPKEYTNNELAEIALDLFKNMLEWGKKNNEY